MCVHTEKCAPVGCTVENESCLGIGSQVVGGLHTEGGRGDPLEPSRLPPCWLRCIISHGLIYAVRVSSIQKGRHRSTEPVSHQAAPTMADLPLGLGSSLSTWGSPK